MPDAWDDDRVGKPSASLSRCKDLTNPSAAPKSLCLNVERSRLIQVDISERRTRFTSSAFRTFLS